MSVIPLLPIFCLVAFAASAQAAEPASFGSPVAETDLGKMTGRADLSQAAISDQSGVVSQNTINGNSITGAVNFDNQAFQNLNGMAVINANTGNNVAINSSFLVNIVIGARP